MYFSNVSEGLHTNTEYNWIIKCEDETNLFVPSLNWGCLFFEPVENKINIKKYRLTATEFIAAET